MTKISKLYSRCIFLIVISFIFILLQTVSETIFLVAKAFSEEANVKVWVEDQQSSQFVNSAVIQVRKEGFLISEQQSSSSGSADFTITLAPSSISFQNDLSLISGSISLGHAYPNPTGNNISFELNLGNMTEVVHLKVYNILGQLVSYRKISNLLPDRYWLSLDVRSLACGIYFITALNSYGQKATCKFAKIGGRSFVNESGIYFKKSNFDFSSPQQILQKRNIQPQTNSNNFYEFIAYTDSNSQINDDIDGWVNVNGYANESAEITGDTTITLSINVNYRAPKADQAPIIDGEADESCWEQAIWAPMEHLWLGVEPSAEDFSGRYKISWTPEKLYFLVEIVDDSVSDVYEGPFNNYYKDDCLEFFIDEDHSGGVHTYNFNAFAYHVALDFNVIDLVSGGTSGLLNDYLDIQRIDEGNTSTWEVAMDIYDDKFDYVGQNEPVVLSAGKLIGYALAYCDNDGGNDRESFIGSIFIQGTNKNVAWEDADVFGTLELIE